MARSTELCEELRPLYEAGRAAWPDVICPPEAFARQASQGAGQGQEGTPSTDGLRGADLYLAAAALSGDRRALAEVEALVRVQAQGAGARLQPGSGLDEEVVQHLLTRLLVPGEGRARLADYAGQGPLAAFLRVAAMRTALNLRGGARSRERELDEATLAAVGEAPDPESRYLRAQHQEAFRQALAGAFAGLPKEQRQAMRLHYGGGLSGQAIARMLGVDRSTVVRWLASARAALMRETRRRLQDRLRLPQAEMDSLIAVLRSQLELSLGHMLARSQE